MFHEKQKWNITIRHHRLKKTFPQFKTSEKLKLKNRFGKMG